MIDFIIDEQKIASKSVFLKIKDGSKLKIKSNLISFPTFYDKKTNQRVLWIQGIKEKRTQELYYFVEMDGEEGVVRLPMSVFIAMNDTERLMKKNKRNFIWIIGKKGNGLQTRYSVIKGEEIEIDEEEIKTNNEKLKKIIEPYYQKIKKRLDDYLKNQEKTESNKNSNSNEDVNPDDIPF